MFTKEQQLSKKKETKLRKKKCKVCKTWFERKSEWQQVCDNVDCAVTYAKSEIKKKQEQAKKARKKEESLPSRVQALANKYGRLREFSRGNDFCVTCGSKNVKFDGGHFLPTSTYKPIRYYTLQINPQCVACNQYNGGRPKEYREYMIKRFGIEKVLELESNHRGTRKYTKEYLEKYLRVIGKRIKRYINE